MLHDVAVVGGGISGLTTAFEIRRKRPGWQLLVLEKDEAAGGKVRSDSEAGFTFEWGPAGFQPAPHTLDLVNELGLEERLLPAAEGARFRYLYRAGGLRRVPTKPQGFLATELLSPAAKLRAALEPLFARLPVPEREESVYDFVSRHFGAEAARALAGPMVLGVAAGDARKLSLDALFPRMRSLESEHGSLLAAMRASRPKAGTRRPAALYSFDGGGMGVLSAALAAGLDGSLRLGVTTSSLAPLQGGGFELGLSTGASVRAKRVVLATPAYVSARLLQEFLPGAAAALREIPYPPVDVFALGYERVDVPHPLDGFGFLVPRGEGVRSLGVIWSSSLFPGVAPAGHVLLRVIAGGALDAEFCELAEEQAFAAVYRDLRVTMGITAKPRLARRISFPAAIPQYELGHRDRLARAEAEVGRYPGLHLAGNYLFGVGVNDCIRDAIRVANEIVGEDGDV